MRRTPLLALLLLVAACDGSSDKPQKDKDELKRSPASAPELPAPQQPVFGKEPPPQNLQREETPAPAKKKNGSALPTEGGTETISEQPPGELKDVNVKAAPTLNLLFQRYGTACYGLDWRFLEAVARAESGLDPKNHTGKYVGLFQLEPDKEGGHACPMFIEPFKTYLDCSNLEDPEVNTAVAAHRFDRMFKGRKNFQKDPDYPGILEACPDASVEEAVALAYVGHNNGPGALKYILAHAKAKGWCRMDKQEEAVRSFYSDPKIGNQDGLIDGKPCHNQKDLQGLWSFRCISADYGVKKWRYGVSNVAKPVKDAGVSALYAAEDREKCPALQVPAARLTPKP